ncbi:MAG: hypothetical protein U0325_30475 [Polyangiales bacterium]
MPQVFAPSLRALALQSVLLATTTWLALRLGLQLDARGATLASLGALGCRLGLRVATHRPGHRLVVDDDGLRLERGGGEVRVARDDIEGIALEAGELSDGGHALHVGFARIRTRRGPQLAVSDLSALGGASLRTPDARAEIVDVEDPELLVALLGDRAGVPVTPPLPHDAPAPGAAEQALAPSPLNAARALAAVVGARALFDGILAPDTSPAHALLGCAIAAGAARLPRLTSAEPSPERAAPFGIAAACAVAWLAHATLRTGAPAGLSGWIAGGALLLCAPVRPLPGGALARAAGRGLWHTGRALRGALLGATLLSSAVLFATGHALLGVLLLTAVFEALDGLHATRRHARWALLPPRSIAELAALRARLRPFSDTLPEAPTRARDHAELTLAAAPPPRPAPWRSVVALALAVALAWAARSAPGVRWMRM